MKSKLLIIFLLFVLCLPAIMSLFHPGFFQSDDGEWMIIRFSAFHQALRDGQFPVRFLQRLNYGYGYPVADFLYPGFMYLGETLKLLGFGFTDVVKITLGISLVESLIFSYFWLARLFGKWQAFVGALVYLYTPYHLFDVYKRGSVGETLALATVPFVLWQIERKSLLWTGLGIALLVLSHNTLVLLFIPIILIYGILRSRNSLFFILYSLFFGLGLSAFFWIPALYDLRYTVFSQIQVSQWQHYFVGVDMIGVSTVTIFLIALIQFFRKEIKTTDNRLPIFFFTIGILALFFAIIVSAPLWKLLPVSFVQFPFRFLSITILSVSFLSAFLLNQFSQKPRVIGIGLLFVLLSISAKPFVSPVEYFDKGDSFYATNEATTTVQDEYMPVWVKAKPTKHFENKVEVVKGKGEISNVFFSAKKTNFTIIAQNNAGVRINTVYFPGWKASLDGKDMQISYSNENGIIMIDVPHGQHEVLVSFGETPIRLLGDVVSLLSLVALFAIKIKRKNVIKI